MKEELVILVSENDEVQGQMEKIEAHQKGVLHRAFSVFIFNTKGEMLLQRRALNKYHSAGLWSNACCSHPYPGEETSAAAIRRLREELGFSTGVTKIFDFTYKAAFDNGLTEYEFDHVFTGEYNGVIHPNPDEVCDYCYKGLDDIRYSMKVHPEKFTAWLHIVFPKIEEVRKQHYEKVIA
ncbi:MAG: isopentenyl-diphosphate Delta-isomerase [Bacteroidetes bacterium]|nr:isopentenyl-diphosphate Delta-isomerase [Bacteroidota bacterium]